MCHIQVLKEAETRTREEVAVAVEAKDEVERERNTLMVPPSSLPSKSSA